MERDLWLTAAGVILGGAITIGVSWLFYMRAAKELMEEVAKLRVANNALFGAVINPDAKRSAIYDEAGNLISTAVEATGSASGTSSAHGVSEKPKQ